MGYQVYVISKNRKPLMPTQRFGRVKKLLDAGLAVPICNNPFTIRLKYDTPEVVQSLYLGIDSGRENIGLAVSKENGEAVFMCELETHNKLVKKKMSERAEYRKLRKRHKRISKQRHSLQSNTVVKSEKTAEWNNKEVPVKEIKYPKQEEKSVHKICKGAESQFCNRNNPEGWLTPSGRQLIQMHMIPVKRIMEFLPVSNVILETVCFDFQKMENTNIYGWQYQQGPLYGYKSYKDYITEKQHGHCIFCDNPIVNYHHIKPKSEGGTDMVSNIVGLCEEHHTGVNSVHKNTEMRKKLEEITAAGREYKISLLNSVMPQLIQTMESFCNDNNIQFDTTNGFETYKRRKELQFDKTHSVDALCISYADREVKNLSICHTYKARRYKKNSKNYISKLGSRIYKYNGKIIAMNRHKSTGQVEDSLEEYLCKYLQNHTQEELNKHFHELEIIPSKRIYTYRRDKIRSSIHAGDMVKYEKKNKVKGNTKTKIFIADMISVSSGVVCYDTKSKNIKYCRTIKSGCVQFTK